jgi:hypothetical protein
MMLRAGVSHKAAASHAEVSLGRFYQIAKLWHDHEHPSALGVGMHVTGARGVQRRARDVEGKELALHHMRALLDGGSSQKTTELIAAVAERMDGRVSSRTLLRWLKELRQTEIMGHFGARLAFDFCPVAAQRPDGRLHVLAVIVDRETRTLLGASIFRAAAKRAMHEIRQLPFSRFAAAPALRRLSVATGANVLQSLRLLADLDLPPRILNLVHHSKHFGRPAGETLGRTFASLQLRPGAFDGPSSTKGSEGDPMFDDAFMLGLIDEAFAKQRERLENQQSKLETWRDDGTERMTELLSRISSL